MPVRGYVRSAIYDIQRRNYCFIPNDLCDILVKEKDLSIPEIKKKYLEVEIDSYFEYVFNEEIGFRCDEEDLNLFPDLDTQWHTPFEFETAIVDFKQNTLKLLDKIVGELDGFAIPNVQLRFFEEINENQFHEVVNKFSKTKMKFFELIAPNIFAKEFVDSIATEFTKVGLFVLTSSNIKERRDVEQATIFYTPEKITSHTQCGLIQQEQFAIEMRTFCESVHFNSCLNCKLSIDADGNIKNSPSLVQSFGNIENTTVAEVLKHSEFKKYWSVSKDKIEICKDCEFRHMCTDCRAYLKQPNNMYSQPAKCNYNPYIAKWKGEDGYISVEECGSYNENGQFVLHKEKVDAINLILWGE
jgi:SPASM domain peptide maturase of grasp-with-spasm system